jgi:hypothetical protein
VAGIFSRRVSSRMNNIALKQRVISLAVGALLGLLTACATSPYASKPPLTASRDSSGPVRNPDIIDGGNRIPVTTYYNWPPMGDNGPR